MHSSSALPNPGQAHPMNGFVNALVMLRSRLLAAHGSWRCVDVASLMLRLVLGADFMVHGLQKLFGPFGGMPGGITNTTGFFNSLAIPIPHFFAIFVGLTETIGGGLLILGLLTTIAAIALAIDMIFAIITYSAAKGFFTDTKTGGWEFDSFVFFMAVTLVIMGPGRWSLDRLLGLAPARSVATRDTVSDPGDQILPIPVAP